MKACLRLIVPFGLLALLLACEEPGTTPGTTPAPTDEQSTRTIDPSSRGEAVSLTGTIDIQKVISPLGIEAWLVEEHSIPIVALNVGFLGGSYLDPAGKEGLARFFSALIDEGAGDYDSQEFQSTLDEYSISLFFSASKDSLTGGLSTLSENKALAFDLLRLALTQPRFDDEPVERVRAQLEVMQNRSLSSPGAIASERFYEELFGEHNYARKVLGTPESLAGLTRSDLDVFRKTYLTRDRLKVAVVGDITADELAKVLDEVFGNLPVAGEPYNPRPVEVSSAGRTIIEPFESPQSTVIFGGQGLLRSDDDFMTAYVVNHVLGGGGFTSRLMDEVREKRGLTYGIRTSLRPMDRAGLHVGSVGSDNAKVAEAISITKAEIDRWKTEGVTPEELADAKTYLTGAFALGFDSNGKIASRLLAYQMVGLPFDYINVRNDMINAVTLEETNRVLQRFPPSSEMTFVIVGQPVGLVATE